MIRERQREDIKVAKKAGVYKGRKKTLTAVQVSDLQQRAVQWESKVSLARSFGISRVTVFQYLKGAPGKEGPGTMFLRWTRILALSFRHK
ncbi:hypothetical protein GCM10010840_16320 [Deinococcus aerolatus]|uniref:Resolvase/invertase-type recombinase catalytic domain-containing protein n=1 Tax=Deinococcus aerolatus TaxID=522487 RepID=A0ABQ2G7R9_9DEIO|nr:hypothetical protein [Deinococcus aerolatus]GGL79199.1 hypothetical protein GCM10010840_16320 [Deinococcus aerolatus]